MQTDRQADNPYNFTILHYLLAIEWILTINSTLSYRRDISKYNTTDMKFSFPSIRLFIIDYCCDSNPGEIQELIQVLVRVSYFLEVFSRL